jgi:hypothetical protein
VLDRFFGHDQVAACLLDSIPAVEVSAETGELLKQPLTRSAYPRRDLNPHFRRNQILNLARLPITPLGHSLIGPGSAAFATVCEHTRLAPNR